MRKILFLTNLLSPYRVEFFDQLGKNAEVTVLVYERQDLQTERDAQWFRPGRGNFRAVQLKKGPFRIGGQLLCTDVLPWLKKSWDDIIICGYSAPTTMLAICTLKRKKIPFLLEVDGGLIRQDSSAKRKLKQSLVRPASGWFSSGKCTTDFLCHYGADREKVYEYPFSSLTSEDILENLPGMEEKQTLRRELGMTEKHILLAIGQFIPRKGFDILMKAAPKLTKDTGIYIVGGVPTEEYRQLRHDLGLHNVHFVGFTKKEELQKYYLASDLFVLPTREDIWGLVIEEAMACGLPVITTDHCVAGLELIEDGVNGYLVPVEDVDALAEKINLALERDLTAMGQAALEAVRPYTIENMVKVHLDVLEGRE